MQLKPDTLLQGGKYRIIRVLGQGGFGITYEAKQVNLGRKVAIKEFFMKDCCERDESTSQVTVGTGSQRQLVEKFRGKFIREARMIAGMDHPNIVRVTDVFEDNGTAYYVMDNLPGGSLADKVKKDGPLPEAAAEKFIREVAGALDYIHGRNTVHLDVKPSNILLNAQGNAVLIDFGISKHYDDSGEQTSSTPVGISKGFAPLEQSRDGDVSQFKPSTDIYALGATLYYLVTGKVPPEASIVNEDGVERPQGVSDRIWNAIDTAMRPKRKDRPQNVEAFLALLDASEAEVDDEETVVPVAESKPEQKPEPVVKPKPGEDTPDGPKKPKTWLWILLAALAVIAGIVAAVIFGGKTRPDWEDVPIDSVDTSLVVITPPEQPGKVDTPPQPEETAPGSLKVSSTPSGATIWLDGKNTKKTTPDILENLAPGKHTVKLVLEEYNDLSGSVTITSGKRAEFNKTLTAKEANVQEKTTSTSNATSGEENGHQWVDLGLSVKWATCNVGATSPSDYGKYFAWGETSTKSDYSWETYKYRANGDSWDNVTFSKYNTASDHGTVDNKKRLDFSDDAARQNWGGKWRMPTKAEFEELLNNCNWSWTSQGGKNGYRVTSKKNDNNIFLPAAGSQYGSDSYLVGSYGGYWSSSLYSGYPSYAWRLTFDSSNQDTRNGLRYDGFPVRPVTE